MSISNVISLLSGIALFLFGMALMGDGLKKVAGNKLEVILYQLTGKPLKGFLLGTAVTAVIQSSSATSVMVVGFVNSGMMRVRQAISIVMGAILGTSITAGSSVFPTSAEAAGGSTFFPRRRSRVSFPWSASCFACSPRTRRSSTWAIFSWASRF